MKNKLFLFTLIISICSCSNPSKPSATASTPASGTPFCKIDCPMDFQPANESFEFSNKTGIVMRTSKESIIIIPENAFVMENGSVPAGPVKVEIMEIHTPAEIILSGIPMNVNKGSETVPFISDGMFDIDATCNGSKLKLADNKEISVGSVSTKNNKDFDYWYFDEIKGEWANIGNRNETYTEDKVLALAKEINPGAARVSAPGVKSAGTASLKTSEGSGPAISKPSSPVKMVKDGLYMNFRADYSEYPELATYKHMLWQPQAAFNDDEFNREKSKMESYGANVKLECTDQQKQLYKISYGTACMHVTPVFYGSDLEKANKLYLARLEEYNQTYKSVINKHENQLKSAEQFNKTYNLFTVNKMGVYNCDRYYNYSGPKNQYTFRSGKEIVDQYVFAVLKDNLGVIALSSAYKQNDAYALAGNEIKGFIHTSPDGSVTYAKNDKKSASGINKVDLINTDKAINNVNELNLLLAEL